MNFSEAMDHLNQGHAISRDDWVPGDFIVKMPALNLPPFNTQSPGPRVNDRTAKWIGASTPLNCLPYIASCSYDFRWQPGWQPLQEDMFAQDWNIYRLDPGSPA